MIHMQLKGVALAAVVAAMAGMAAGGDTAAAKADSGSGVGVTVKVGTLGMGGDVTLGLNRYLGLRAEVNGFQWETTRDQDEGRIYADFEWLTAGLLLDVHPFGGGFRLSGGGLLNKNRLHIRADLTKAVDLNGEEYWLDDLQGEATFNDVAPYVGIGYGNAAGKDDRWQFACDFGVLFQGSPKIGATATASDPALQEQVDEGLAYEVAQIQDDANRYKYYPVIALGLSFRF
jgi:hypothetical protein